MISNKKQFFLLVLMLISTSFFGYSPLEPFKLMINALCVSFFWLFFIKQIVKLKKFNEGKLLIAYVLFFLLSCAYGVIVNDQSPTSLYQGIINYMGIMTFAYCCQNKIRYKEAKNVLLVFSVVFCFCYIIQWIIYPSILFQGAASDSWSEERFRMRLPGSLGAFFIFLTGVEKLIDRKYLKAPLFIILGGIPIIVMGFRSLTLITIIASILLFLMKSKLNSKSILSAVVAIVAAFAISQTSIFNDKLEEMQKRQETEQTFSNEDYIRWIELDFYMNYYNKPGEWILGGGVPCGTSKYSQEIQGFLEMGLYWQDLGIVGLTFIIGIITVCILVYWSLRMMARCGHLDLGVERMTMFVALFGSIMTSMEYFRPGNFMILGLLFYCEYIRNIELGAPSNKFLLRKRDYC